MNVLHVNTDDIKFGAGRAAYRLHRALQSAGVRSRMLVQDKYSDDSTVIGQEGFIQRGFTVAAMLLDKLPLLRYRNVNYNNWNLNWYPRRVLSKIRICKPDIVHLPWIGNGFIPIAAIPKLRVPVVWTFHDMWAFTGGCHYTLSCTRFINACGKCPQLQSGQENDISRQTWNRKHTRWRDLDFNIIALNRWMEDSVRKSSLLRDKEITVIPNCIDPDTYKPVQKTEARKNLGLPEEKKLLLFGAVHSTSDPRKGYRYLQSAMARVASDPTMNNTELVIFGASKPVEEPREDLKTHYMGTISDEATIASLYSAADVFIAPSIQDNLPNTVLEASACGTPSVAFDTGGLPDLIEHKKTGYLAQSSDSDDLCRGIKWVLEDEMRYRELSFNARRKAEREFSPGSVAKKHIDLYTGILDTLRGS